MSNPFRDWRLVIVDLRFLIDDLRLVVLFNGYWSLITDNLHSIGLPLFPHRPTRAKVDIVRSDNMPVRLPRVE